MNPSDDSGRPTCCGNCSSDEDSDDYSLTLEERVQDTVIAAMERVRHGHSQKCVLLLTGMSACTCGHDALVDALKALAE